MFLEVFFEDFSVTTTGTNPTTYNLKKIHFHLPAQNRVRIRIREKAFKNNQIDTLSFSVNEFLPELQGVNEQLKYYNPYVTYYGMPPTVETIEEEAFAENLDFSPFPFIPDSILRTI